MLKQLQGYDFAGFHASHIGALKSCAGYYGMDITPAWIFGMTGQAFLMIIDEHWVSPNVGLPEEDNFALAANIGLRIQGRHSIETGESLRQGQREAWEQARSALDRDQPAFAKEIGLGNETSLVYAYGERGYYTKSWHGGTGHEGADQVIGWDTLGLDYCPCEQCAGRQPGPSTDIYLGRGRKDGGLLSMHWAEKSEPAVPREALKAALAFALAFNEKGEYEYGTGRFFTGLRAVDQWLTGIRSAEITGFYMGYYADIWHESRHYAALFLEEAQGRIEGADEEFEAALQVYKLIRDAYSRLTGLFPWMQPRKPIEDPFRRREAIGLLSEIKALEEKAEQALRRLLQKLA